MREAVTAGLDDETLTECHRRLAFALEAASDARERPEVLVPHFAAIGEKDRAATYAIRAAERAAAALAFDRAAMHYATAVDLSDAPTRELRLARVRAVARAGRGPEAAELYLREYVGGDEPEQLGYLAEAVKHFFKAGHIERGQALIDEVCAAGGIRFPASSRRALMSLAWQRWKLAARGTRWRDRAAVNIAPMELARVDLLSSLALGLSTQDSLRAADFTTRWVLRALRVGEPGRAVHALAMFHGLDGTRSPRAMERATRFLTETLRPRAEAADDTFGLIYIKGILGLFEYYRGHFTKATDDLRAAERSLRVDAPDAAYEISAIRFFDTACLRVGGRVRELSERAERYLGDAILQRDRYAEKTVRLLSNIVWLARDDLEQDLHNLEQGLWPGELAHYHLPHSFEVNVRVEHHLYAGSLVEVAADLEQRVERYRRSLIGRVVFINRAEMDWTAARLALGLASRGVDAKRNLARAGSLARRLARIPFGYARMWSALIGAALDVRRGRDEGAVIGLRRAIEVAGAAETPLLVAAARHRLGALIGGDEGSALVGQADDWFRGQGVVKPARFADILAPGFAMDSP